MENKMNCLIRISDKGILALLLILFTASSVYGWGLNVGEDWTNSTKDFETTGDVTAADGIFSGEVDAGSHKYNQGDTNAVDTTIEAKLQAQVVSSSDYTSLALAVSNIGAVTETTLHICGTNSVADSTTITFTANITPDFTQCRGTIQGTAGGGTETLVVNGDLIADDYQQIFGSNLTVSGLSLSNINWFGADATGTADSGAAFTAAHTSLTAGGTLYFPSGTYLDESNTSVTITQSITVKGAGKGVSILTGDGVQLGAWRFAATGVNYLNFEDFSMEETGDTFIFTSCDYVTFDNISISAVAGAASPNGILFNDCEHSKILNSDFYDCNDGGIAYGETTGQNEDSLISGCYFFNDNATYATPCGVIIEAIDGLTIDNSVFEITTAATSGYGIYQGDNTSLSAENFTFSNLTFRSSHVSDIVLLRTQGVSMTNITSIDSPAVSMRLGSSNADPVSGEYTNGIYLKNITTTGSIVLDDYIYDVEIAGGKISGATNGVYILGDTAATDIYNVRIHDLIIQDIDGAAARLAFASDIDFYNNTCIDANLDANATGAVNNNSFITLGSSMDNVRIHGNSFENTVAGSGDAHYAVNIFDSANQTNVKAWNNRVILPSTAAYRNMELYELTIAAGVITPPGAGYFTVDTEADAATDDLNTITTTYLASGDILYLGPAASTRDVTFKDAVDNLHLGGDIAFATSTDTLVLLYTGTIFVRLSNATN